MSDLFSFDEQGRDVQLEEAANAPSIDSLEEVGAPWYSGITEGLTHGLMRGSAATADFLETFGKSPAMSDEQERINAIADDIQEQQRKDAIDYWTPRANEVGRVGQVLGGAAEIVPPLLAGLGNPALAVGTTALKSGKELVDEGVDSTTAGGVAAIEGATTYAGMKVPFIGKTLASRIASGAVGNAVVGSGSRAAEGATLESQGYGTQAEKYSQDLSTLSTDVLMGMLFGTAHHIFTKGEAPTINPKLTTSEADAILTARNAKSFAEGTTPGAPDGLDTEVAHQEALSTSLTQLSRGEQVNIGDVVARHDGGFRDAEHVAESAELARLVEEVEPKDVPRAPTEINVHEGENGRLLVIESSNGATTARVKGGEFLQISQTETAEAARGKGEGSARMRKLMDIARERGLTLISDTSVSADAQRFYEGMARRGFNVIRNAAARESDGTLISTDSKPVFEVHPMQPGGSVAAHAAQEFQGLRSQLPADQNLGGSREGAAGSAGSAGAGGAGAGEPLTVYRGGIRPLEAGDFGKGPVEGATTQPASGLGVHFTSGPERAAEFGNVTEHHLDIRKPFEIPYEDFPHFRTAQEYADFAAKLKAEGYDGITVDASHVGGPVDFYPFAHEQVLPAGEGAKPAEVSPQKATGAEEVTPEVAATASLVESQPDTPVLVGYDVEGKPIKTTLAEAYAESQAQLKRDLNDAKSYEAAITCFLGRGA